MINGNTFQGAFTLSNTSLRKYNAETWDIMQYLFAAFNDHQIRSVIYLDKHINEARLRRAVALLAKAFPLLCCRYSERAGRPCWEELSFVPDMFFLQNAENIEDAIQQSICSRIDELVGPQFTLYIIRNKHTDALCVNINHMLCDGEGFKEILYLLASIYNNLTTDSAFDPDCSLGSRSAVQVLRAFSRRSKLAIILSRYTLSRHDNHLTLALKGDRSTPFILTLTTSGERFLAMRSCAKQYGATINDLILAAYIRTLYQMLGDQTANIQCILDLRKYLPDRRAEGFCNLTSNLVCDIGPEIGACFEETLYKVKKRMDAEKADRSCVNLIMLLEFLFCIFPYRMMKRQVLNFYHNPPFAMSNLGIIDEKRLSFNGLNITGAFMTGSIKYAPLLQLALSTFKQKITFTVACHGTQADKELLAEFLLELDREIALAADMN